MSQWFEQAGSPVDVRSRALEDITDAMGKLWDAEADARTAYDDAYAAMWNLCLDVAASARSKHVDCQDAVVEAKNALTRAESARKKGHQRWEAAQALLTAAMSNQRFQREQS